MSSSKYEGMASDLSIIPLQSGLNLTLFSSWNWNSQPQHEKKSWFSWKCAGGWDIYPFGTMSKGPLNLGGFREQLSEMRFRWAIYQVTRPLVPNILGTGRGGYTPDLPRTNELINVKHASWGGGLCQWSWSSLVAGHHQFFAQNPAPRMYANIMKPGKSCIESRQFIATFECRVVTPKGSWIVRESYPKWPKHLG